ncbi:MAG: CoA transferase [Proteobacteria bacterium]|nr:CoA transferase [Pseudomonadota bacterium]
MGQGPLSGVRVVEFTGLGPGPFAAMLLSDLGAEVLRIDRLGSPGASRNEVPARGRASLALDLKQAEAVQTCLQALESADILIEGFRPGVLERLGLGPAVALARNPRLVYGRMTGWGQEGPLAQAAGHDINYIALTGGLAATGEADGPPVPPLNLLGDYGGGALYLAFGVVAALYEAQRSGKGQVVDAAIVDGSASLMAAWSWLQADGIARAERGASLLGGAAHFYRCYRCADGAWVSVGALEPQFWAEFLRRVGLDPADWPAGFDSSNWAESSERLAAVFATQPRDHWRALLEGSDACFAPVLSLDEAPGHPHLKARGTFIEAHGQIQPAPAPRFSRTPGAIQGPPPAAGEGGRELLDRWLGNDRRP